MPRSGQSRTLSDAEHPEPWRVDSLPRHCYTSSTFAVCTRIGLPDTPALWECGIMRIYLFIEHYPNPYKPWIDTQLIALLKAGHDVTILAEGAYNSTIHDEVREFGLESKTRYYPTTLRTLPAHGRALAAAIATAPAPQVRKAVRVLDRQRPFKTNLLAAARAALLPDRAPDACYIHNLVTASRLTFLKQLYPGTRVCLYFHGGEVGGQSRIDGEPRIFASVDAVITGTRFAAEQAVERGCAADKIAIVPLGFHLPDYTPAPDRRYRPDGRLRLVSVGRASPEKGFLNALQAVKQLVDGGERGFTYRIIGTGIQYAALQAYVYENRLTDIVSFLGEMTRRQVAAELEQSDVLVLPSIVTDTWAETQATVVQEALLMGCVTLTTRAGGVPESNAEVMQRFAVPPGDVAALRTRIEELLRLDAASLASLAVAGRDFAVRNYDITPLMARIVDHATRGLGAADPARFVRPAEFSPTR